MKYLYFFRPMSVTETMGRLLEAYRRHIGGTESTLQLYTGFVLFFVGAAMALFGIFLIVSGNVLVEDSFDRKERAIFMAALGLPLVFAGLQLTLPSRHVIHALVGVGALICVYGVARFAAVYPDAWETSGVGRSGEILGLYTVGLILLFTTTAMALVINFVSRHMVLPGHEPDDIFSDPDRGVTVEEILADIERETSKQNLTWGGMGASKLKSEVVKLKAEFGADYVISGGSGTKTTEIEDDDGEEAYRALMRMRGRDLKEQSDQDDTMSAVQALIAMRREQKAERERSWWYRFKRWLVTLFTGGKKRGPQRPPGGGKKKVDTPARTMAKSPPSTTSRSE